MTRNRNLGEPLRKGRTPGKSQTRQGVHPDRYALAGPPFFGRPHDGASVLAGDLPGPDESAERVLPRRPRRTLLLVVLGLLAIVCLCPSILLAIVTSSLGLGAPVIPDGGQTVDAYFRAMADEDFARAHALCTLKLGQSYSPADLAAWRRRAPELFAGYRSSQVTSAVATSYGGVTPTLTHVAYWQESVVVTYEDGHRVRFEAYISYEADQWRLCDLPQPK